jgi:hypothetical protein
MDSNNSNKKVGEMTDDELQKAYALGAKWCTDRMQGEENKNALGQPYNHADFMAGLERLENIEDEMKKRGFIPN